MSARHAALSSLVSLLAALSTGCAHHYVSFDVRAVDTGLAREFTYEERKQQFEASTSRGPLLQFWLAAGGIQIGTMRRETRAGCHAGLLSRRSTMSEGEERTGVMLCPRDGAPAGWQGWHVDFEQTERRDQERALPPSFAFDIQLSPAGDELLVSSGRSRAKVTLAPNQVALFRRYPELLGFSVASGVVPGSPQGKYEAFDR